MGNPAGERRKKSEKRRAKHEARIGGILGGGAAYLPKDFREDLKKEVEAVIQAEEAKEAKK